MNLAYTLAAAARTSAGVYDGDVLIRTLWSNEQRNAGTYDLSTVWDGKDDSGNEVANRNYTIRVVTNTINYTWEGVIGNTSTNTTGVSRHNWTDRIVDLCVAGDKAYYTCGYLEGMATEKYFSLAVPNVSDNVFTTNERSTGFVGQAVATDGTRVYFTGYDPNLPTEGGVYAFNISDNSIHTFSSGGAYTCTNGRPYSSVVDRYNSYQTLTYSSSVAIPYNFYKPNVKITTIGNITLSVIGSSNGDVGFVQLTKTTGTETVNVTGTQIGSLGISSSANSLNYLIWTNNAGTIEWRNGAGGSGAVYISATNVTTAKKPTGLAVQKTGNYLFVARKDLNRIHVLDKVTGELVQEVDIVAPGRMVVDETNLWVISNTSVNRYTVNLDGKLSLILTLSGLTKPIALGLSPTANTLLVVDGSTSQQVKAFNTVNGSLLWTHGQAGGYAVTPDVADNKFCFRNTKLIGKPTIYANEETSFIAFKPDGTFWLGDMGNQRALQVSADRSRKLDEIICLGYHYSAFVDRNNPRRVFSNYLEWEIDYSKPLQVGNGSWKLKRNWSAGIVPTYDDQYYRLRYVSTLSNNRTYAMLRTSVSSDRLEVVELTTTGIRYTGVRTTDIKWGLEPNGDLLNISNTTIGQQPVWKRRTLTGFDNSGNPQYSALTTIATAPTLNIDDPLSNSGNMYSAQITSNGNLVVFSEEIPSTQGVRGSGYHLGAVSVNGSNWKFRTSKATRKDYVGDFPEDGAYDIGNGVNYGGSFGTTIDNNIITGYRGENWKSAQTNKFNHYLDNGLMLGQFGITEQDARLLYERAAPGSAGNANTGTVVKVGNDYYLYHCDETHHSGTHRWKISNLNSIQNFSFTIQKTGSIILPPPDYVNLMASIPISGTITSGTGRWTYSPASYNRDTYDLWKVQAGLSTYKRDDRSLRFTSYPTANKLTREGYCDLSVMQGMVNNYSTWQITGRLTYPEISEPDENFIDVLDNAGKVIVRISRPESWPSAAVKVNSKTIVSGALDGLMRRLFQNAQDLSIRRNGSNILVGYAGYPEVSVTAFDPAANLSSPTTLRIHFYSTDMRSHQIDLANLRLYSTPTVVNGTGSGLAAEYFNNRTLTAPVSTTRTDATVNFNWSANSPIPGTIGVDDFSVRWSGQVQAPVSGDYVFSTACDDGVRLWVNGVLVINNWVYHSSTDNSTPITLTAGQKYDIKLEYYEGVLGAKISLLWTYTGQSQQPIPKERLYPANLATGGTGIGLAAQYFNNRTLTAPVSTTRTDATVNFNWSANSPIPGTIGVDDFSVRWSGQVQAPVSGDYVFSTACDDGVRLWVNGVLVINNWVYHSSTDNSTPITLTAGQKYDIKLEYYEGVLGAKISLLWTYTGQSQQPIPKERLYPANLAISGGRITADYSEINSTTALHVYPVPAQDFLWVRYYANETGDVSIRLVNENAQSVLQAVHPVTQGENTFKISVKGFARGIYLINLMQGSGRVSQRVILSD